MQPWDKPPSIIPGVSMGKIDVPDKDPLRENLPCEV